MFSPPHPLPSSFHSQTNTHASAFGPAQISGGRRQPLHPAPMCSSSYSHRHPRSYEQPRGPPTSDLRLARARHRGRAAARRVGTRPRRPQRGHGHRDRPPRRHLPAAAVTADSLEAGYEDGVQDMRRPRGGRAIRNAARLGAGCTKVETRKLGDKLRENIIHKVLP